MKRDTIGPIQELLWPLSLLQDHDLQYVRVRGENTVVEERTFTKEQINEAIDLLVEDLDPSQGVLILPD